MRLVIALFLATFIVIVDSKCDSDEISSLNSCYADYFQALGITTYDWNTYNNKHYADVQSLDGINALCNSYKSLQQCLGSSVINDCVNEQGFSSANFTSGGQFAKDFTSNYHVIEFQCGNGNEALKKQYNCVYKYLDNCNHADTNDCATIKDTINCVGNFYKNQCGQDGYYYTYNVDMIQECYLHPDCGTCNNAGSQFEVFGILSFVTLTIFHLLFK